MVIRRRILAASLACVLVCAGADLARAQGTPPPKAVTRGIAAEPKPPAPVVAGAEPTLIGQFGTWGAYSATPNGRRVCFALAKPTTSKTNPPNRPRDPA
jgi:hypothetical protein